MRKIHSLPIWPLVAVALSVAATGGLLSQRPDSETAATAPTSSPATTTTPTTSTSTVTSVRTVTVTAPPPARPAPTTTRSKQAVAQTTTTTTTPEPTSTTTTATTTTTPTSRPRFCDPSYPTLCLSIAASDVDCEDLPDRDFPVRRPDRHRLDPDRDGVGCETP